MKSIIKITAAAATIFAAAFLAPSCSTHPDVPEGMFTICGEFTNIPDSAVIEFLENKLGANGLMPVIATDTIIDGKFELTDSLSKVEDGCVIYVVNSDGFPVNTFSLYVESGTYIEMKGYSPMIPLWEVTSTVSKQQEEQDFVRAGYLEEYYKISIEENSLRKIFSEAYKKGGQNDSTFNATLSKAHELSQKSKPARIKMKLQQLEYLENTKITDHWLYLYNRFFAKFLQYEKDSTLIARIKELYEIIPDEMLQTKYGKVATAYIFPPKVSEIGDPMVDGTLYDTDGNIHTLTEFKGRYILLDFWSQGCGPCVQAIPEMEQMAEKYGDKLAIVSISGDPRDMWQKYVAEKNLKGYQWNELSDLPKLYRSYGVMGIPYYVFIDQQGIVQRYWAGYRKGLIREHLEELIK